MSLFDPDIIFSDTLSITLDFLAEKGIKYLLLDVDNTLTTHGNPDPAPGILEWITNMKARGIQLIIVSNNYKKRVQPFADRVGLPFVSFSTKPLPFGIMRAMKKLGAKKSDTALVGDQVFTDVLGAHLMGLESLMVLPILEEDGFGFKLKRKFEKKYVDRYIENHGGIN